MAGESRSLLENRLRATRRLKLRIATEIRHPIVAAEYDPPAWIGEVKQLGRLAVSHRNAHYARLAALVLDLLASREGRIGDVGALLGVTTSSVVKFLETEPPLWAAANAICKEAGHPTLERRR